jgi:general stress protein 26
MEELWDPELNNWFDGKEDPGLVLIKVVVDSAYFWDAKENKVLNLIEAGELTSPKRKKSSGKKKQFGFFNH